MPLYVLPDEIDFRLKAANRFFNEGGGMNDRKAEYYAALKEIAFPQDRIMMTGYGRDIHLLLYVRRSFIHDPVDDELSDLVTLIPDDLPALTPAKMVIDPDYGFFSVSSVTGSDLRVSGQFFPRFELRGGDDFKLAFQLVVELLSGDYSEDILQEKLQEAGLFLKGRI